MCIKLALSNQVTSASINFFRYFNWILTLLFGVRYSHVLILLLLLYPFDSLPVFPYSLMGYVFLSEDASSMLLSIQPASLVNPAIFEGKDSKALFYVFKVLSDILPSIRPGECPISMHFVILPPSLINLAIFPLVLPKTLNIILKEIALIRAIVSPHEFSLAVFLPISILA